MESFLFLLDCLFDLEVDVEIDNTIFSRFLLFVASLALLGVSGTAANEVKCEFVQSHKNDGIDIRCFMNGNTDIDADDYTISDAKNLKVEAINCFSITKSSTCRCECMKVPKLVQVQLRTAPSKRFLRKISRNL